MDERFDRIRRRLKRGGEESETPTPSPDLTPAAADSTSPASAPESLEDTLLAAEIARLQGILDDETEAEEELARLELEYHSVQQAVADARHRLEEAREQLVRVEAEAESTEAQRADRLRRIEAASEQEAARIDKAMGAVLRLTSARATAEAQVETLTVHLEELRAEQVAQNDRILEVTRAITEAKVARFQLEKQLERVESESAAPSGTVLSETVLSDAPPSGPARSVGQQALPEPAAEAALAEAAAVLDAAAADLAVETGEDPKTFDPFVRRRSLVNASWNSAFALLSVLVMLLGFKALTADPSATEAFCAEAPVLDVAAARQELAELGEGARPGSAFSTFEQGRYAYTTTTQVDDDVRRAAADLEAAHAAVADRKGKRTSAAELEARGAAVFDADAALRTACAGFTD